MKWRDLYRYLTKRPLRFGLGDRKLLFDKKTSPLRSGDRKLLFDKETSKFRLPMLNLSPMGCLWQLPVTGRRIEGDTHNNFFVK